MRPFWKVLLIIIAVIVAAAAAAALLAFLAERIDERRQKTWIHKPAGAYERFLKRPLDCFLSTGALLVFSPLLLILTVIGAVEMRGNPFFTQERPGRFEKIFKLIKFRTMNNKKDGNGQLLPDDQRLTAYGRLLRSTSLDELPELFNIIVGDMAVVGPRPLLTEYLPYYTAQEHHRHDVRPGLTGLAQINGRNNIGSWEERFAYDLEYVRQCSFRMDAGIIFDSIAKVVKRSDILVGNEIKVGRLDDARRIESNDSSVQV